MKKHLITLVLTCLTLLAVAQDQTPIVVNLRDNARLQFNGQPVKMKAVVCDYSPVIAGSKDFRLVVKIQLYESVAGAYGSLILTTIGSDATLSDEEKDHLYNAYADRVIVYTTVNKWVNVAGDIVTSSTPGAIPELQYWQNFKLNQVAGMGSLSTQGAVDAQYLIIKAIINKLNTRKNL